MLTLVVSINVAALLLSLLQLLISHCRLTKILALDLITLFVIILMGIIALYGDAGIFCLDIGVLLALSAFIGTVAFAKMALVREEGRE